MFDLLFRDTLTVVPYRMYRLMVFLDQTCDYQYALSHCRYFAAHNIRYFLYLTIVVSNSACIIVEAVTSSLLIFIYIMYVTDGIRELLTTH